MKLNFKSLPNCIAIVGSRSFAKSTSVHDQRMFEIVRKFVFLTPKTCEIVSGGALGVDTYAAEAGRLAGRRVREFLPDEKLPSPARFFERNTKIVEYAYKMEGVVVAFTDIDNHRGTDDTIKKAKKRGVPVIQYGFRLGGKTPEEVVIPAAYLSESAYGSWGTIYDNVLEQLAKKQ